MRDLSRKGLRPAVIAQKGEENWLELINQSCSRKRTQKIRSGFAIAALFCNHKII
jgi:hypothetical protein